MEKPRKDNSGIIIIFVLLITILVAGHFILYNMTTTPILISPTVEMDIYYADEGYEIKVVNITHAFEGDKWLKLDRITFLLFPRPLPSYGEEHFPLGSEGGTTEEYFRAFIKDKNNPYNLASGKLNKIVNEPNNDVSYYDRDNDKRISVNDTIVISYSLIPRNLTNESYLLDLIYIGDLEGSYSHELFEFIGSIRIEKIP